MNFSRLSPVLVLVLVACTSACAKRPVKDLVQSMKAERSVAGLSDLLLRLGIPKDSIARLTFAHAPPDSEGGMAVQRAETFLEDLDGDGRKESVSQVIFQTPPSRGKSAVEYIFMVHGHGGAGHRLLFHRTFGMMKCGHVAASGMRFTFVKTPKPGPKAVHFKLTEVSTCDVGGQAFKVGTDTLQYRDGDWMYRKDAHPEVIDRMGDPEGP